MGAPPQRAPIAPLSELRMPPSTQPVGLAMSRQVPSSGIAHCPSASEPGSPLPDVVSLVTGNIHGIEGERGADPQRPIDLPDAGRNKHPERSAISDSPTMPFEGQTVLEQSDTRGSAPPHRSPNLPPPSASLQQLLKLSSSSEVALAPAGLADPAPPDPARSPSAPQGATAQTIPLFTGEARKRKRSRSTAADAVNGGTLAADHGLQTAVYGESVNSREGQLEGHDDDIQAGGDRTEYMSGESHHRMSQDVRVDTLYSESDFVGNPPLTGADNSSGALASSTLEDPERVPMELGRNFPLQFGTSTYGQGIARLAQLGSSSWYYLSAEDRERYLR